MTIFLLASPRCSLSDYNIACYKHMSVACELLSLPRGARTAVLLRSADRLSQSMPRSASYCLSHYLYGSLKQIECAPGGHLFLIRQRGPSHLLATMPDSALRTVPSTRLSPSPTYPHHHSPLPVPFLHRMRLPNPSTQPSTLWHPVSVRAARLPVLRS